MIPILPGTQEALKNNDKSHGFLFRGSLILRKWVHLSAKVRWGNVAVTFVTF